LLGSWNEIKHSVKHGIAKLSWFLVLEALGLVVLNLEMCRRTGVGDFFWKTFSFLESSHATYADGMLLATGSMNTTIWAIIGGLGALGLLITEPAGMVELLGPLSNTISYTRLAGIAVAKAALASAMNLMILPLWENGMVGMIACVLLLIVAHSLVLGLGILSGAVQAMRLNFFEFFSKFMAGGGTDYAPFGRVRQYTAVK
jgi:V/A-type H+-transporting ATPase subunit I